MNTTLMYLFCFVVGATTGFLNEHHLNYNVNNRIIGGNDNDITNVPYVVQIELKQSTTLYCGGSILSERFVLTGAVCTYNDPSENLQVRYGTSLLDEAGTVIQVLKKIEHPHYNSSTLVHNLCVLHLESHIIFSDSAQPIRLSKDEPLAGEDAILSGWGSPRIVGHRSHHLQSVVMPIIGRDECLDVMIGSIIDEGVICAGTEDKGFCDWDWGGPLVINGTLSGVASWSMCQLRRVSVYTNVIAYTDFINSSSNNSLTLF